MYNLKPPGEKLYIKHNSKYRLNCTSGWIAGDVIKQTYVDVRCSDGSLQIDKSCEYNLSHYSNLNESNFSPSQSEASVNI